MSAHDAAGQIIAADTSMAEQLARVIALAFHDLAPSRWLVADEAQRRAIFPGYFRIYLDEAFRHGLVQTTTECAAVAVWIPTPAGAREVEPDHEARLAAVTGAYAERFRAFDRVLDAHHPTGWPHHHLAILAVHPEQQRRGIGTALLQAHHDQLDALGMAAYLEASDAGTREMYRRIGYQPLPNASFHLPDGPAMYPMLRSAGA